MHNKLKIKIREGTRSDGRRLCDSCRFSTIMRGAADSEERIYCAKLDAPSLVPLRVVQCNKYDDRSTPSLYDYQQIAWVLETSPSRKIGFVSPEKRRNKFGHMPDVLPEWDD
jgi:hypothetical protein